jgi:8-oxo-dGTP pyrophosphatase MutT (NUDIX family)
MLFTVKPDDFVKDIDVVGCYLESAGEIALLLRPPHKSSGSTWGLPAGKVDAGETLVQAMARELSEETGLTVAAETLVPADTFFVVHPKRSLVFHTFSLPLSERPTIILNPEEHEAVRWVSPHNALALPLVTDQDECIRTHYGI